MCTRCGNLKSVCSDPNFEPHPHTTVCWSSAVVEWAWRQLRKKYPPEDEVGDALHPLDGLRVYASQQEPETDEFA